MVIRPAYTNVYFQRAAAYKSLRESRIINEHYRGRPYPGQPYRRFVPSPQNDPLKKFLDTKQAQYKLVKINPFHPPPVVKRDRGQAGLHPYQVKREEHFTGQQAKPDIRKRGDLPQRGLDRRQEKPVVGQPVKPDIYKKGDVPPPTYPERKPAVVTPQVGDPRNIKRRDLNQEQQGTLQMQKKRELDQQKALQMQQRRELKQKEGIFVREPGKPEVRKQVNVPPPAQPRVERKPPVVQRPVERPKKEITQERKTPPQLKKEEEEKAGRRQ